MPRQWTNCFASVGFSSRTRSLPWRLTLLCLSGLRTCVRDRAGTTLTRYRRALERRHVFGAEIAAREMGFVPLRDALGLLALYASEGSPKYDKAATRWLARLALESDDPQLRDVQLAAAALQALPVRPKSALPVLTELSR